MKLTPAFFIGHGSPMNAITENEFSKTWQDIGLTLPKPKAILCISAHWETIGTKITSMENPPTIHDFGGFPKALFDVRYPSPGSPTLVTEIIEKVTSTKISRDESWGLDHGTWSILKHIYPDADVPVVQLSLNHNQPPEYHYALGRELRFLRESGILIIGSGNMVHNLGLVDWSKVNEPEFGYDWAIESNAKFKNWILNNEHDELIHFTSQGKAISLSIPTPEHYLPLLYILGCKGKDETITFFNDKVVMGSLTMTSIKVDGKI